eukprot:214986-Rhodomonas_salina.1
MTITRLSRAYALTPMATRWTTLRFRTFSICCCLNNPLVLRVIFDPIADNHFPMCNTIDVDSYADRNNATDNVAKQVYGDNHNGDNDSDDDVVTDNATDTDGTESSRKRVRDRGGDKAARNCW